MKKTKIGLLPLYLELYDNLFPEMRNRLDTFLKHIEDLLTIHDVELRTAPVCRLEHEVKESITQFEKNSVDAIVTIHLAYSPSLEAIEPLAATKLPVILLDTTPAYSYGANQDPGELMYNHGIHGVQDLCNLLLRHGKPYIVHAGHWEKSDVIQRVISSLQSSKLSSFIRKSRIGIIGSPFPGMGDFAIPFEILKEQLSINVVSLPTEEFRALTNAVSDEEINSGILKIGQEVDTGAVDNAVLNNTIKIDIALQNWFSEEKLTGFTFNFQDITRGNGFPTVPFFSAGRAMASGMGYAGEGDCLTSALVGSLLTVFPETSFTEMFCPDWENETVYLSHMGEVNYNLLAGKPQFKEMNYSFSDTGNPVFIPGRFKQGEIVLTNLAPMRDGFRLITAPAEMIAVEGEDRMTDSVHGWFKPELPLNRFLETYSELGGTHHLAVSYNASVDVLKGFAHFREWEFSVIR